MVPREVVAETAYGRVLGRLVHGVHGFRGVPYGGRVDGSRRFLPATTPDPWTGVFDATRTGPRAVQSFGNLFQSVVGDYFAGGHVGRLGLNDETDSENCLVLNVLTPQLGSGKRPVMFYIHGGGHVAGSGVIAVSAYRFVQEHDVVLVSVNHRLNIFGYLYLGAFSDRYLEGANAGLLDLVQALSWARNNIGSFGGDPENVTIFGESGGGGKVSSLMAMPAAQGLFHKAVIQSGSFLRATPVETAVGVAHEFLRELGVAPGHLERLESLDTGTIADVYQRVQGALGLRLWPVVDGRSLPRHPFDPDAPPATSNVPLVVGHCQDEMPLLMDMRPPGSLTWVKTLREALTQALALGDVDIKEIIDLYEQELPVCGDAERYARILSDASFARTASRQAELKAQQGPASYRYLFRYAPPVEGGVYGAFHTAELPLVFRHVQYQESEQLSRRLAGAWANFARLGDPSTDDFAWPRFDVNRRATAVFELGSTLVAEDPGRLQRELWERLLPGADAMEALRGGMGLRVGPRP